jgi:molybdopterin/thiamine biosynthesis adenylyltransferase
MMPVHERYARLETLPSIGAAGLAELRTKKVAVLGVGNVGGQLAQHLVLLGINVVLVDRDVVDPANLGTQGFTENQLGRAKAIARAEWLSPLNPTCRIEPLHADIRQLGLGALREMSLLFSCLDSNRMLVNEIALRLGLPWIDGALDGSGKSYFGRVACYDPREKGSACYLCPHDAASLRELSRHAISSKGCSVTWWNSNDELSAPTIALSAVGAAVAAMQLVWGLDVLLGHAQQAAGRETYFDLGCQRLSTHRLNRNPKCLLDHRTWPLTSLQSDPKGATVARTFEFAEAALEDEVTLQLLRRPIVTSIRCPHCGRERTPYRVLDAIEAEATCGNCGGKMHLTAMDLLERFGRAEARPFLDRTWEEIGIPPADVVIARTCSKELHILLSESDG